MPSSEITWISGPVLHAKTDQPFRINEAVLVGPHRLLGEVISVRQQFIVVQVYEDTSGLQPGDEVRASGELLAIRLGPGLLGNIFDGLLRPLETGQNYIQRGAFWATPQDFPFSPLVKQGQSIMPGTHLGQVRLPNRRSQLCLVPPDIQGELIAIVTEGEYAEDQSIARVLTPQGQEVNIKMSHHWPVRRPRPVSQRLPMAQPMLTGQRVLDSLFPVARGSKATLPGGFGTGKTVLLETLAKCCDADIIVYVGCGERGNEMASVLTEFPELEDPRSGQALMQRTVIIANTSNMPVAAREASIYTGITIAEYFRDQGLHVALMADSTSRWAEALREVSGRLGELPGEAGYPAYLSSRQAEFYERAARVLTLSGNEGSLTIMGAVSPPAGDFSEPVTSNTKRYVRCFWALDQGRAQARFYPAINPLSSYSEDAKALASWWQAQDNPQWEQQRQLFLSLLQQQSRLERMSRIVGKDALPPQQQLTLLCAELINDSFLRQSAFSPVDGTCSPAKQSVMMRLLARFVDLSRQAAIQGVEVSAIASYPIVRRLRRMGEDIPENELAQFSDLNRELDTAFAETTMEPPVREG